MSLPGRPGLDGEAARLFGDRARTFAFAARFLPDRQRRSVEVLYAFCRLIDDLVDERPADRPIAAVRAELAEWDAWLARGAPAEPADPLRPPLAATIREFGIPLAPLRLLIEGQCWDLEGRPLATVRDLDAYCYRVASTVGLAMTCILGGTARAARRHACQLGMAMQLTNILRDVAEDRARQRTYLPSELLARFPDARPGLAGGVTTPGLASVAAQLAARARRFYAEGRQGIPLLPAGSRYPIVLAAGLYEMILAKIEAGGFDLFAGRAATSPAEKADFAARALDELTGDSGPVRAGHRPADLVERP